MTKLNLDLTTKQINILFRALYAFNDIDKTNLHSEIMDLMRLVENHIMENK